MTENAITAPDAIAYIEFADGKLRPVFETSEGRQYIIDEKGRKVFGVWFMRPEECDQPVIVDDVPGLSATSRSSATMSSLRGCAATIRRSCPARTAQRRR